MRACPRCGAPASESDRFCGLDGTPLDTADPSSGTRPTVCARCAAPWSEAVDGCCMTCGYRPAGRLSSVPPSSSSTSILPVDVTIPVEEDDVFRVATAIHPGLRRENNEDSVTFACGTSPRGYAYRILVVCDGVSTSSNAEQASQVGARIVRDALVAFCQSEGATFEASRDAMADAIRAAHEAICVSGSGDTSGEPPGTTCVAALVLRDRLVVGWVGDSRAYWLTERGGDLLTRDHSWANEAVARGEATLEEAMRSPHAHALTRCLGPGEPDEPPHPVRPDVVVRRLGARGVLLLCSDGLWNYYPLGEQMAGLVQRCGPDPHQGRLARFVVHKALARGGQDNVSVGVYVHVPR